MSPSLAHLVVVPVVLPLVAAALLLLLDNRRTRLKSAVNLGATGASLLVAIEILRRVDAGGVPGAIGVYFPSNWQAPFGIVLVADRLSALMLVVAGVVSLSSAVYATAGWSRAGVHFHALFQIQLVGLNGAFLTADLFNLFVFFEVLLAASYGLHLHGSGWPRVRSGLHYIAVNLLASTLFLVGLAMLYGVMGTLSMADVAAKLPLVARADRGLLRAGATILAVAFLTKAAVWPLNSWLVPAYRAASSPVAALFTLMTKVGVYALLRLSTLIFSANAGTSAQFGVTVLLYGGLATLASGMLGTFASVSLGRIAGFSVIVSSGTLVAAIGIGGAAVTSAALFYLVSATLAAAALFLLVELVERSDIGGRVADRDVDLELHDDTNLDDDEQALVGRALPVSLALLGVVFLACALLVAGLPPLSSFVAKLALMTALLRPEAGAPAGVPAPSHWWFFALLLFSGLAATLSLSRAGIRHFWAPPDRAAPRVTVAEGFSVVGLLVVCGWLTVRAEPVLRYTSATARALQSPRAYIDAVAQTHPVPAPTRQVGAEEGAS